MLSRSDRYEIMMVLYAILSTCIGIANGPAFFVVLAACVSLVYCGYSFYFGFKEDIRD